jgi:hypothetical protein
VRSDFTFGEFANGAPEVLLFIGQREIHVTSLLLRDHFQRMSELRANRRTKTLPYWLRAPKTARSSR